MMNGVCSSELLADKLPFQFNLDILNGVSLRKGCYLGQEIVSRAYNSGIIRRRLFPFVSKTTKTNLKPDQDIFDIAVIFYFNQF